MSSKDEDNNINNNNTSSNTISIKRSTFTKIVVVGIAGLMIASFFGGYTWHATFYSSTIPQLVQSAGVQQQQQQPTSAGQVQQQPPQQQQLPSMTKVASINTDGAPIKGKTDAPVTIVEFGDFQCPFCGRFATDTLQQLVKNYVDTGIVKFVYKEFPMSFHSNAQAASMAAECANEQGKFWPYHDKLYVTQTTWDNQDSNAVKNTFKQYAVSLGLNAASFNSCFESGKYNDKIQKESSEGSQYGVNGTPTFYIGNQKTGYTQVVGAMPVSSFEQLIKQVKPNNVGSV
jgi:protein-disulfide isomerase